MLDQLLSKPGDLEPGDLEVRSRAVPHLPSTRTRGSSPQTTNQNHNLRLPHVLLRFTYLTQQTTRLVLLNFDKTKQNSGWEVYVLLYMSNCIGVSTYGGLIKQNTNEGKCV